MEPVINRRGFLHRSVAAVAAGPVAASTARAAAANADPLSRPAAAEYDDQAHTRRLFGTTPRRHAFQAETVAEVGRWQTSLRGRLRELLGVAMMEREVRFDGRAERAERVQLDGYAREKWYLWTEPDVPLPVWVLLPDKPASTPCPVVLTPHGHNHPEIYLGIASDEKGRQAVLDGDRDIAVQAVREGYVAVLPTARGFGETIRPEDRKDRKVSSCRTGLMHAVLFGRTMIGYRVWDVARILDWLPTRITIDPRRIAITGNSGGGTTSLFAAACDERISVAVPSCYFCTFKASIGSIHHCECNYVPGLLREAEMYDVAGLIAPRPFRAIAGESDPIFPIAAVRHAYDRLKAVYRVAGAADHCELHVGSGGHRYYRDGAWPFIRRWFESFAARA